MLSREPPEKKREKRRNKRARNKESIAVKIVSVPIIVPSADEEGERNSCHEQVRVCYIVAHQPYRKQLISELDSQVRFSAMVSINVKKVVTVVY